MHLFGLFQRNILVLLSLKNQRRSGRATDQIDGGEPFQCFEMPVAVGDSVEPVVIGVKFEQVENTAVQAKRRKLVVED